MKRILCPTDFSDTAQNAIVYAAKLAQVMEAELILFNVQSLFEESPKEVIFGDSHTIEKAQFRLEAQSREIAQSFKISCYGEVEPAISPLSNTIQTKAEKADLIVMGTNGVDDLYQFFAGSNTYNVVQKISIPLLLIPEGCGYSEIERTIYAFDYLGERKLPLTQLVPWITSLNSELSVLQVMEESVSKEAELSLEALQALFSNSNTSGVELKFDTIRSSDVPRSIHSYMLRNQADVLALCTRHHSLLGKLFHKSVIKLISGIAEYPVFIFHE